MKNELVSDSLAFLPNFSILIVAVIASWSDKLILFWASQLVLDLLCAPFKSDENNDLWGCIWEKHWVRFNATTVSKKLGHWSVDGLLVMLQAVFNLLTANADVRAWTFPGELVRRKMWSKINGG